MGDPVEHPVAHDQRENPRQHPAIADDAGTHGSEDDAPDTEEQQRMRIRVGDEIERRERGRARIDSHLLDAERHQKGPEQIGELRRGEQDRQREPGSDALGGEAESKVAYEHPRTFSFAVSSSPSTLHTHVTCRARRAYQETRALASMASCLGSRGDLFLYRSGVLTYLTVIGARRPAV